MYIVVFLVSVCIEQWNCIVYCNNTENQDRSKEKQCKQFVNTPLHRNGAGQHPVQRVGHMWRKEVNDVAEQENGVVNLKVNLDTTEADKLVEKLKVLSGLIEKANSLLSELASNPKINIGVSVDGVDVE